MRFEWAYVYAYYMHTTCILHTTYMDAGQVCQAWLYMQTANQRFWAVRGLNMRKMQCVLCMRVMPAHYAHQVCRQVWACLCVCSRPRVMSCLSDTPGLHFCAWGATACHCHRDAQGGGGNKKRREGKGKRNKIVIREWEWQRQGERGTFKTIFQDDKTEKTKEKARWI